MSPSVLVVDDESSVRSLLTTALAQEGFDPVPAASAAQAHAALKQRRFDLALLDVRLGEDDGLVLLQGIRERHPGMPVVIMTGYATVETAVQAMRLQVSDYLVKPFDLAELLTTVRRVLEGRQTTAEAAQLQADLARSYRFEGVVGRSPAMREVYRVAAIVAPTNATVLIMGETGTGKELLARSIHLQSRRASGPLVVMNCGAVPETLLETEIFGHERGAFTGAMAAKPGRFERAEGGTIFLDEIGDMSPTMQIKLLRVLQERTVERVGGTRTITVDCRVIAATNKNLYDLMRKGKFREDLYYRLSVVPLEIPPLRQRVEDVPVLAEHFLRLYRKKLGRAVREITPAAMRRLQEHAWPGNVRELEFCIERAVLLCAEDVITTEDIRLGDEAVWRSLAAEPLTPAP